MRKHFLFFLLLLLTSFGLFAQNAYIANSGDSSVSVINTASNIVTGSIPIHINSTAIVVSPDGKYAYVSYFFLDSSVVTVINTQTRSVVQDIHLNNTQAYSDAIEISPDGSKLYVSSYDTLYVISTASNTITTKLNLGDQFSYIEGIAASPDGAKVYITGSETIHVMDAATNAIMDEIPITGAYTAQLAVSPDNKKLYAADDDSSVLIIVTLATKAYTMIKTDSGYLLGAVVNHDGSRIYVTNNQHNTVSIIDGATNQLITNVAVGSSPYGISITPDDSKVYVVNEQSNNVSVINTTTNLVENSIAVGKFPVSLGKFISGGNVLPITLLDFKANLSKQDVKVQWKTEQETNTSYFNVERSSDGRNFTTIAKIKAAGNSSITQKYVYNDINIESLLNAMTIYYRVQSIDIDGSAVTSNTVPVILDTRTVMMLLLPNPVRNNLNVRVKNYTGKAIISINSLSGTKIMEQTKTITEVNIISINTSFLPAGIYILKINGKNISQQQKFIKD